MSHMPKTDFALYVNDFKFKELFIDLGWNNDLTPIQPLKIGDTLFTPRVIADKNGFKIIECQTNLIPSYSLRLQVANAIKRLFHEHLLIFYDSKKTEQVWLYRYTLYSQNKKAEIRFRIGQNVERLFQRAAGLIFELDEQDNITIVDVTARVRENFATNAENITKSFYGSFKNQHAAFLGLITGIKEELDKEWYASIMLNRLMFCYFMQRRGFLNKDRDYLRNKLNESKSLFGKGKFYSFYRSFLLVLFQKGFGSYDHSPAIKLMIGEIPYLNGGIFDLHEIEQKYPDIDISDDAFEKIFNLFDRYEWHLDTRDCATGNEINPDVLGYIFEKYINDRASMGAYYTQEDITDYISRSTIIPWLLENTKKSYPQAFKQHGAVWSYLQQSGDTYIFDSVKHGSSKELPEYIAIGIDTNTPDLLERRTRWNEAAPDEYALPTEIWREVVERQERYKKIKTLISSGDIQDTADFITNNLDIEQFVIDLLDTIEDPQFIQAFYASLERITILDPTCGSGAFLFAALNILEPLYQSCLSRMDDYLNHDHKGSLERSLKRYFDEKLEQMENEIHPNKQYFIYKSIILNNLYGVDIMREAVETAKLRLFLKLVSTVDPNYSLENLGIEPLPDIDFNIKSGNTLLGYASEKEIDDALSANLLANTMIGEVKDALLQMAKATAQYKQQQLGDTDFKTKDLMKAKADLSKRQASLNRTLSTLLRKWDYNNVSDKDWHDNYLPFHWVSEFYAIIVENKGFDIIIGNPPYVEYSQKNVSYRIKENIFRTYNTKNLYSFVFERAKNLLHHNSFISLIVQISSVSTPNMEGMVKEILHHASANWISNFATRPACLFEGVTMNLSIITSIICKDKSHKHLFTTQYNRWQQPNRKHVFQNINYTPVNQESLFFNFSIPKMQSLLDNKILSKLAKNTSSINDYLSSQRTQPDNLMFYRTAGGRYFKIFIDRAFGTDSTSNKQKPFSKSFSVHAIIAVLNSNLWWWYYTMHFDMYNCKDYMIYNFPFDYVSCNYINELTLKGKQICDFMFDTAERKIQHYKTTGYREQLIFSPSKAKHIIDEVDSMLSKHYNFTNDELDYILNYDVKWRKGITGNIEGEVDS